MARILLVEDDESLREVLAFHLEEEAHRVVQAADAEAALEFLRGETVDLVLTDVRMPGMSGTELLHRVRESNPDLPVVVMTAYGTIGDAVEAMKQGAADYLTKPVTRETLLLTVKRVVRMEGLARENRKLREVLREQAPETAVIGTSAAIQAVLKTVRQVAPTEATVLITGESGTGKELVARTLHALSPRAKGPFVAVNCAAVPKDLLESELFGHEKGAFTGASSARPGKFLSANGGTLFLDEIGDMDMALQAKILRALQERVVDPVGARTPLPVDVRVVSATHRDLERAVREGVFREDLFWRLKVIPVPIPPLRDRPEDVLLLMSHFYVLSGGGEFRTSGRTGAMLEDYPWPGNIRELQNLCQRLAVLHPGQVVTPDLLPAEFQPLSAGPDAGEGLWGVEREAILRALRKAGGNQSEAARMLKIPRHILRYRMRKFGMRPPGDGTTLSGAPGLPADESDHKES